MEYDRIVAVFLLVMGQTEFRLVHNEKENCYYRHIPFNLEGISKAFLGVLVTLSMARTVPIWRCHRRHK